MQSIRLSINQSMDRCTKYKEHQKIICVETESWCKLPLKRGEVYTVKNIYKCQCGSDQLILEEAFSKINMICKCGYVDYRYQSYYEWRFKPYEAS